MLHCKTHPLTEAALLPDFSQESSHDLVRGVKPGFPQTADHGSRVIDQSLDLRSTYDSQSTDDREPHGLRAAPGLQVIDHDAIRCVR